jgi:hypothetical protein
VPLLWRLVLPLAEAEGRVVGLRITIHYMGERGRKGKELKKKRRILLPHRVSSLSFPQHSLLSLASLYLCLRWLPSWFHFSTSLRSPGLVAFLRDAHVEHSPSASARSPEAHRRLSKRLGSHSPHAHASAHGRAKGRSNRGGD